MRKPVTVKTPVKVVAELKGLGNKVVDFAVTPFAAYGLTYREGDQSEPVVDLVSVSLSANRSTINCQRYPPWSLYRSGQYRCQRRLDLR
jgi:hypothetical protein